MPVRDLVRRRLVVLAAVGVSGLAGCAVGAQTPARLDAEAEAERMECEAVAQAVRSVVPRRPGVRYAMSDSTLPFREMSVVQDMRASLPGQAGLDPTTWRAFVEANRTRRPGCRTLSGETPVVLVSDSDVRALRAETSDPDAYWRAFHARFPETAGLTTTSGVGLSADRRQALVIVYHGCGGLCGHGHVVLLERGSDGQWRVHRTRQLWVS